MRLLVFVLVLIMGSVATVFAYGGSNPAEVGHTLGEIADSTTLCRSNGLYCPDRTGTLSCTDETGSWDVSNADAGKTITSTIACETGYTVTGGGCEGAVTPGSSGRYVYPEIRLTRKSGNGWKCSAFGDKGDKVRAVARCCKIG